MTHHTKAEANVQQAVPFFAVSDMQASLRFYVDGMGFCMTKQWVEGAKLRWCWLDLGGAALMLQEYRREGHNAWVPTGVLGEGVSICFICQDALAIYRQAKAGGLPPAQPFVGNAMWVTSLADPDGYRLDFESNTDVPEGTVYAEDEG